MTSIKCVSTQEFFGLMYVQCPTPTRDYI